MPNVDQINIQALGIAHVFPRGSGETLGLTKREYMATHIMAGDMPTENYTSPRARARAAVRMADRLLLELALVPEHTDVKEETT